ncbi:MAG: hypothetical protein ACFE89_11355 [Candidatus Hodarchaeota archaeon]
MQAINAQIAHISEVFTNILLERGLLESQLFPVNAYISLSCYNTYETQYEIMSQVWARISPEILAQQSKVPLSEIHALSITYQWLYYGLGRMGIIFNQCDNEPRKEPKEKQEEWRYLLDHWHRLGSHYFNSGKPTVESAGYINQAFGEEVLTWLQDRLEPVSSQQVNELRKIIGAVDLYAFMDECEARAKIIEHGPYPISKNEILVISEYTHLFDGHGDLWLPWSKTEAKLPTSTLGVAFTLKDIKAKAIDVGTITFDPAEYGDHVTGVVAYTKKGAKITSLGLDELPAYGEAADAAQQELFLKFASWDKQQRLIAGAKAYMRGFARFTNQVGITDQIEWDLTPHVLEKYVPYFMEHDGDNAFARMFRPADERAKDPTFYWLPE